MSFRDFRFPAVVDDLRLGYQEDHLFPNLTPAEVSADLVRRVNIGLELAQGLNCEKGQSEFVIAPFLLDLWIGSGNKFGQFSGYELSVDEHRRLYGVCGFLLSRCHFLYLLRAPILAAVEAKNDNVSSGFGQCIATMLAGTALQRESGAGGAGVRSQHDRLAVEVLRSRWEHADTRPHRLQLPHRHRPRRRRMPVDRL